MVMLRQKKISARYMLIEEHAGPLHIDTREGCNIGSAATHSAIEGDEYPNNVTLP